MTRKRASLTNRPDKGRGVDAIFDPAEAREAESPAKRWEKITFSLFPEHQDALDEIVYDGKRRFRHVPNIGRGAVNKSAVVQTLLELLESDKELYEQVLEELAAKARREGSRHRSR